MMSDDEVEGKMKTDTLAIHNKINNADTLTNTADHRLPPPTPNVNLDWKEFEGIQ